MAAAAPPPVFTVTDAIIACGVDTIVIFDGANRAQRIAADIFDDDFTTCIDKTTEDFDNDLKDYSALTVANGQIRLNPATKRNMRAFIQWCKDCFRLSIDPTTIAFPIADAADLIRRAKTHKAYVDKSKTISDTATPSQFTDKVKWLDWSPTLLNFLRAIPGRNGVPLSYVCRPTGVTPAATYADFLNEYIDRAPLTGTAFITDAAEVHTYLVKFISDNDIAESKIQGLSQYNDGRRDFLALKDHYEGVGVNALDVTRADRVLDTLFYSGEKRPHMWWGEFERVLNEAFTIYDRREGRQVHSEHMKLRILCRKVTADFLQSARSTIQLELAKDPITITYQEALTSFRNQVNLKFPPEMSAANNRSRIRRVQEFNSRHRGRGHSGRGGRYNSYRGNSRGGRFGRGGGRVGNRSHQSNNRRNRNDARMVRCQDGTEIEVHPSYKFNDAEWNALPEAERNRISLERSNHKRQRNNNTSGGASIISEITTQNDLQSIAQSVGVLQQQISSITSNHNNKDNNSNTTPPSSIMGGRNEQASLRSRRQNN